MSQSGNPFDALSNIVQLLQQRFDADVCSLYLLEPDRSTLVLAATIGLRPRKRRTDPDAPRRRAGPVAETL